MEELVPPRPRVLVNDPCGVLTEGFVIFEKICDYIVEVIISKFLAGLHRIMANLEKLRKTNYPWDTLHFRDIAKIQKSVADGKF